MSWMNEKVTISKWLLFVLTMGSLITLTGWLARSEDKNNFYPAALTGLCSGFVVLLIDKWIDRKEIRFLSGRDHIENVIEGRENEKYYEDLINSSKRHLDFLGRTGRRLLEDFADVDSQNSSKRSLLRALDRGVVVRFLVAKQERLDEHSARDVSVVEGIFGKVKNDYPRFKLEVKHYDFDPSFSYFRSDDKIIFGPNFPQKKSRHTPSVVADVRSAVSKAYMQFFDDTWDASND